MSQEDTKKQSNVREGLALVVGGLFVLGIVFATYSYFNKGVNVDTSSNEENSQSALDKLKNIISSNTARDENTQANNDNNTVVEKKTEETTPTVDTQQDQTVSSQPVYTATWAANDYNYGDIKGGSYTVKSGDTLWEIAEGVYGNGAEWTKILAANNSSVGFLSNGKQTLIVPGQVLVLP